jgi:hypothetical protein
VGGGALRRIESLSAVALPDVCEKGGGQKNGAGFPSPSHARPGRWQAGAKGERPMRRYKCDPRWINVRFEGECVHCKLQIRRGERAFYYPEDHSLYCEAEECGKAASREFSARAFDEENNTSM